MGFSDHGEFSSAATNSDKEPMQHAFERPIVARLPAHLYFIINAVFHYMGPAFAVLLFAHVDLLKVAWLRIASAALIFAAWKRPWRYAGALSRQDRRTVLALGVVLAAMTGDEQQS
jgi:inner membrane transporter RhtA